MSGRLTVWIDGREALPVRAIPFVAGWRGSYSPDEIAANLARTVGMPFAKLRGLVAYRLQGVKSVPVLEHEWRRVVDILKGYEAELREKRPNIDAMDDDAGYAAWLKGATQKLPAGVFVWLDEFLRERDADCGRIPNDPPIVFIPMLDPDEQASVLEGFRDCSRYARDVDKAMIGYADLLTICQVDDPKTFGGFRVETHGLYVDVPNDEALLTLEERAELTWHPTGRYSQPALPLPCALGELRAFLNSAGLVGSISEDAVIEVFGGREHMTGWYDATLEADMWFGLSSVSPREAAMLLCQINPNGATCDPTTITTDETRPEDYKRLLRLFEDVEKTNPTAKTLRQWLATARKRGLKYHSWIDPYALANKESSAGDAVEDEAPIGGGNGLTTLPNHPQSLPESLSARRIKAIVETTKQCGYDPMSVAYGGKSAVERTCLDKMKGEPWLFTTATFKKAWQAARKEGCIEVENVEIYRGK